MEKIKMLINEAKENLKNYDREKAIENLFSLCDETGNNWLMEDIIYTDDINDFIKNRLDNGDWQGVACCLANVNYLNDEYYLINGYGNLEEITIDYLNGLLSDFLNDFDFSEYEEIEE